MLEENPETIDFPISDINVSRDSLPLDENKSGNDVDDSLSNVDDPRETRYKHDTKNRDWLTKATVRIIICWLTATIAIVLLSGFRCITLSDTVLCMLLGTTTINVLGLAAIVLKGFFKEMNQNVDLSKGNDEGLQKVNKGKVFFS